MRCLISVGLLVGSLGLIYRCSFGRLTHDLDEAFACTAPG